MQFKNALVSCSNKAGLVEFLTPFAKNGMRLVSTGGTADHLRKAGLSVVDVSEQTGFEEVMDGRVKTLHPKVHMALLARMDEAEDRQVMKQNQIEPFDLVVGNLYPFEENPSIETIDIGGPSFLRSAAKSFNRIAVICDPKDYVWVAEKDELTLDDRQKLAAKVFAHTSSYDSMIAKHFSGFQRIDFNDLSMGGKIVQHLRYGENPQQKANWFRVGGEKFGIHQARVLQGKELSYNNLLDVDSAVSTLREFAGQCAGVAVKHNSPCGVAVNSDALTAVKLMAESDPVSIFGGVIALNFKVDKSEAGILNTIFLECIVAPKFTSEALAVFAKKKNVRLLEWPDFQMIGDAATFRSVSGGFLVQSRDEVSAKWGDEFKVFGEPLNDQIKAELVFAMKVAAHLKSNAIAITGGGQTLGLGMGQVNRVDAVEQAVSRAKKFHPKTKNSVLASDGFFPFADSIDKIFEAGIRYVIQPGGSLKDEEVKARAKECGITMVLTGRRHFTH